MRSLLLVICSFLAISSLADEPVIAPDACEVSLNGPVFHHNQSQQFWQHISQIYAETESRLIKKHADHYYAAKKSGDEHSNWLTSVGYRFGLLQRAPSLKQLMDKIEKQVNSLDLADEQKIYPRFTVVDPYTQTQAYVKFGDTLPEGNWVLKDGFASTIEFYEALTSGVFPLGSFTPINSAKLMSSSTDGSYSFKPQVHDSTVFNHDLAHISALILHPELMQIIAQHKNQIQTALSFLSSLKLKKEDYRSTLQYQRLERFGFIFEDLLLAKPHVVQKLFAQIQFPEELARRDDLTFSDVYSWLSQQEDFTQIHLAINDAIEEGLIEPIGGAPRDVYLRQATDHPRPSERNFLQLLKSITNTSVRFTNYDLPQITAAPLFNSIAKVLVHLVYLQQLDITTWANDTWSDNGDSLLRKYIENSGVFWQHPDF